MSRDNTTVIILPIEKKDDKTEQSTTFLWAHLVFAYFLQWPCNLGSQLFKILSFHKMFYADARYSFYEF